MSYKIVMDSSGDLFQMEGADFSCVPLKIRSGEREFTDDAKADAAEMVNYLRHSRTRSASACPSVGEYLEAFGEAENVFCITITSNLSGSYNAAKAAADTYAEMHPDRKIHVFDTLSAGPEMTLLAEKLRELIAEGTEFDTAVAQAQEYLTRTRLVFSLESLHNLAVNGRVPGVVAKATGILGIRLIGKASDVGTLQPVGKARGEGKVPGELMKHMLEAGYCGGRMRIHHCLNLPAAEAVRSLILRQYPDADVSIGTTGILCSFYAEQGGLLIGYEV